MYEETFLHSCRCRSYSLIAYIFYTYILMYLFFLCFFFVSRLFPSLSFHFLCQFLPFLLSKQVLSSCPANGYVFVPRLRILRFVSSLVSSLIQFQNYDVTGIAELQQHFLLYTNKSTNQLTQMRQFKLHTFIFVSHFFSRYTSKSSPAEWSPQFSDY